MTEEITFPKRKVNPKQVVWLAAMLAALLISFSVIEFTESKAELTQIMNGKAQAISGTIRSSSLWNITANEEIETQLAARLLTAARYVKTLDSLGKLDDRSLTRIAAENNVFRMNIFDESANRVMSNIETDSAGINFRLGEGPMDYLRPILNGERNELIIGLKDARHAGGKRFAVAISRSINRKGAIVANVDAGYMVGFRDRMGLNKMVNDLSKESGVGYIIIQDESGVLASAKTGDTTASIRLDPYLRKAFTTKETAPRMYNFGGEEYFESVNVIDTNGAPAALLRIGLRTSELKSLESRMLRRGVITSLVLIVIGVIVITFFNTSQNLKLVQNQFRQISTLSGSILQNMSEGIITTSPDGVIRIFNRSAAGILGIPESEAIGANLAGLDGLKGLLTPLLASLENQKALDEKEYEITHNGKKEIIALSTRFTAGASVPGYESFTIVLRLMTSIRKMEAAARHTEKLEAVKELASKVAHEIRNPLNAISMIAQRYKKEFRTGDNQSEFEKLNSVMLSETKRVNGIIEQFLKYSRPQEPVFAEISSASLAAEITPLAETLCAPKKIRFELAAGGDFVFTADSSMIKQLLMNLIINAAESIVGTGLVRLDINASGGEIVFTVTDSGPGIAPEDINRIFDLYFSRKENGSGLGLSIARQIAALHGGDISAAGGKGGGAVFTVRMPLRNIKE